MKLKKHLAKVLLLYLLCGFLAAGLAGAAETPAYQRIISLAPSLTEILYALDLGDRVVGVTRYCDYPEGALAKTKVGGLMDPNYEAMVALKPDLVILMTSHRDAKRELAKMGIATLTVPHQTIADIHESIQTIGKACGASQKAAELLKQLEMRILSVSRSIKEESSPRVLISVGRDISSGQLAAIYVAGRNGFYDEIVALAGGTNAYTDEKVPYPQLSAEGVIRLNPDVIVDLVSMLKPGDKKPAAVAAQWDRLAVVSAVQHHNVHVVVGNHALRPGPRYVAFLEQLARLLHPKAFGPDPEPDND